jgi:hypothetical protein
MAAGTAREHAGRLLLDLTDPENRFVHDMFSLLRIRVLYSKLNPLSLQSSSTSKNLGYHESSETAASYSGNNRHSFATGLYSGHSYGASMRTEGIRAERMIR